MKPLQILQENYDNLLLPGYDTGCISHIPHHIKYLHGLEEDSILSNDLDDKDIKKTILFIVDGFGYKQWHEHQANSEVLKGFANRGTIQSITSMFPSSTAPSITGLSTGLTTQQHGLLEWTIYESETDQVINTLPFNPIKDTVRDSLVGKVSSKVLLDSHTLFEDLQAADIKSYTLVSKDYAFSAYSQLAYPGSNVLAHASCEELFENLKEQLTTHDSGHFNVYWGDIDSAGHVYGPNSPEYAAQVTKFFSLFEKLLKSLPADSLANTRVMITADHGQIEVDPSEVIWLDEIPGLSDSLALSKNGKKMLPWGLQRDMYLQITDDKLEDMFSMLTEQLAGRALVIKSADALESGLFGRGDLHPKFKERIGNVMVLPNANNLVWYRHSDDDEFRYKGMHGGLNADEVRIAFGQCSLLDL